MGLLHDDGLYVVNAKSLAEGHGYRLISLPEDIPQTKYPVLFPLGLSLIWRIVPSFPDNVFFLKLLPFGAAMVWFLLIDRFLAYQTGRPKLARVVALLTAASPSVMYYSTTLLAETLFAAFAWGGLWMLARCEREGVTLTRLSLASLFCGAAYHTRTLGLTLIVAGIMWLMLKAKYRAALAFGALTGALALPWGLWVREYAATVPDLYTYYTGIPYRDWNLLFGFTLPEKLGIIARNALLLLIEPARLIGLHSAGLWPLMVLMGVLIVFGFVVSARRRISVGHVFVALYLGTLLLWAWPPGRFLLAIYPLLLYFAWLGGDRILAGLSLAWVRTSLRRGATVAFAFTAGWGSGTVARNAVTKERACLDEPCERTWQNYLSVMSWVEERTQPGTILMGTQDPMLYLYTERKSVRAFDQDPFLLHYADDPDRQPFGPPDAMAERIRETGADYLVLAQREESVTDTFLWRQFLALKRERPGLFESEMTVGAPDFGVYRINREVLSRP